MARSRSKAKVSRTSHSGRWLAKLSPGFRPLEQNSNGGWPQAYPRPGHVHPMGKLGTASYPRGPASGAPQRRAAGRLEPRWLRQGPLSLSLSWSFSLTLPNPDTLTTGQVKTSFVLPRSGATVCVNPCSQGQPCMHAWKAGGTAQQFERSQRS